MKLRQIVLLSILVIITIAGAGYILFLQKSNNTELQNNGISEQEQEFNNSGQAKAILSETDMWMFYQDEAAGFSIKYPSEDNLVIESKKIQDLEGTMGFNKETAESNRESLKQGNYGKNVDWPLSVSKQVVNIGPVNAQKFMVVGRFEVCDVVFERALYFIYNDYQVLVKLSVPKKEIIETMPEYFTTDSQNCGEEIIWNFEKQESFYQALENSTGSETANNWFKLFDQIVGTIEFDNQQSIKQEFLQGKWVSLDDEKAEIEFNSSKIINYYDNQKLVEGTFRITNNNHLTTAVGGTNLEYTITELTADSLTMTYLPRGNTLKYKKIN